MKRMFLLMAVSLIVSCGKKSKTNQPDPSDSSSVQTTVQSNYNTDSLKGEYIGGFGNSTIIISVNYINGSTASGYNTLKGNRRNIKGEMKNEGGKYSFVLAEPGGEATDGEFSFDIDTATRTMEGTWVPNDSVKYKPRKFKLIRRKFVHDNVAGYLGFWYLNDLQVELKEKNTGMAKGYWFNEKTQTSENVEIPFSWFEEDKGVAIEWGPNNIFLSPKMKFKRVQNQYEDMLQSGDYIMYRY